MTDHTPTAKAVLYRKLSAVAGAVAGAAKDGRNKDQNYTYPTPASVMNAVKPHLAEQGLAIVPHLVEFAEIDTGTRSGGGKPFLLSRVTMHYHILDGETGESIVVPWQAQAGTYGDDKGLAKAQTIALRTFLIQIFQIPAEDPETDPDHRDAQPPQSERRQPAPRQAAPVRPQPATETKPEAMNGMTLEQAEARFAAKYGQWGKHYTLPKPTTVQGWINAGQELRDRLQREDVEALENQTAAK